METSRWLFALIVALSLANCESRRPQEETGDPSHVPAVAPALPADTSRRSSPPPAVVLPLDPKLGETWARLQRALRQRNAAQLNQFIDPALGLWVIEDGPMGPVITRVAAGAAFRRSYARVPAQRIERYLWLCSTLQAVAQLPEIDCGEHVNGRSGFMQDGCFSAPAADFRVLNLWARARLRGGTSAQGRVAQGRVTRTVLHTPSSFRFHFAQAPGGRWHLVFVDLRPLCIS